MNTWRRGLAVLATLGLGVQLASGAGTNTWEFDFPARYTYDPTLIGVTQSTAQLLLQSDVVPIATFSAYTNAQQIANLEFGEPVSLHLAGAVGTYATNGLFTSRIIEGGLGNLWRQVTVAGNAPVFVTDPDIISYYAMDNDAWIDQVTQLAALQVISGTPPAFTTDAKVGSHAGRFITSYLKTTDVNPLYGSPQFTVAFWYKMVTPRHLGGFYTGRLGSGSFRILQLQPGNYMETSVSTSEGGLVVATQFPTGLWTHVALTWNGNADDKRLQVYFNGQLRTVSAAAVGGVVNQSGTMWLATDNGAFSRVSDIYMDDFILFRRSLSATEVEQLYGARSASFQSLTVQIRSGFNIESLLSRSFIGPDGTPASSYFLGTSPIGVGADFNSGDRFVQYQARLLTDRARTKDPSLRGVRFEGNVESQRDVTTPEIELGTTNFLRLLPEAENTPFVGLAKRPNGGYYTNGVYLSRVFDAGAPAQWARLEWQVSQPIPDDIPGMVGLWHMDQNWNDTRGGFRATSVPNVTYTTFAKIGGASAVFNGSSASASGFGDMGSIGAITFWIENNATFDEVMRLTPEAAVFISNRMIRVLGTLDPSAVTVFVNGSDRSASLLSGWNHVAINFRTRLSLADTLTVGEIPGVGYMSGALDEMAVFSRELTSGEVHAFHTMGNREVAGRARIQISDATLTNFFGPNGQPDNYFTQPPQSEENNLTGLLPSQRYFRYKLLLDGEGNGTPMVRNIRLFTGAQTGLQFADDTIARLAAGTRVAGESEIYGSLLGFDELAPLGPSNLRQSTPGAMGIWHMDDDSWSLAGLPVVATVGGGGRAYGNASPTYTAVVGTRGGQFDGDGDYIDSASSESSIGADDFSASIWFNTTASTPGSLMAVDDVFRYFVLQVNSDGVGAMTGAVSLAVNDGTALRTLATLPGERYNDGHWHHVVGVRQGEQLLLYVDGERRNALTVPGLGNCGLQSALVMARHPVNGTYYAGRLDEAAIFDKALSDSEIGNYFAGRYRTGVEGAYESTVISRDQPSTWQRLQWAPLAPFGRALSVPPTQERMIGLWHLDEASGPLTNAITENGLNGSVPNGATYRSTGRFDTALSLNAAAQQYVQVGHNALLEPTPERLTIEAWVNLTTVENRTAISKRTGTSGYELYTDASGRPVFWCGDVAAVGQVPLRAGKWTHLAGVYDGVTLKLFVDGQPRATAFAAGTLASGGALVFGRNHAAQNYLNGQIDQVAVHGRALAYGEVLDHYLAGAINVGFQARTSMDPVFTTQYVGPGRATNTFYTAFNNADTAANVDQGLHFQFRARATSEDHRYSPALRGVQVYVAGYPTDNPTIHPVESDAYAFLGHLLSFSHVRTQNQGTDVRYQLSGDTGISPRWFYFDTGARRWLEEDQGGLDVYNFQTSSEQEVSTNIVTFYSQVYNKTGGVFRFRAFLHSAIGQFPAILDRVRVVASSGRINVVTPDGEENGDKSWLVQVPYDITWDRTPGVTGTIRIEFSSDGGRTFPVSGLIAASVPVTNLTYRWTTPSTVTTQGVIRLTSNSQPDITDVSDKPFTLQQGLQIVQHNGGPPTWYIGETNQIIWRRSFLASPAHLEFSASGDFTGDQVRITTVPIGSQPINSLDWVTPMTNAGLVSEAGRLRAIQPAAPNYNDVSDAPFQLYGGVVVRPAAGEGVKKDVDFQLQWVSAGMGPLISIEIQGEPSGPWMMIDPAVPNVSGLNTYTWLPTNTPTETARLRLTSLSDARAVGLSHNFIVAAVELVQPVGKPNLADSEIWLQNTTQDILWVSGGAGPTVNLMFSTNSGQDYMTIATNIVNINTLGVTNRYPWIVAETPSPTVRMRVEDASKPLELFSISPYDFQIAGLRIVSPNGAPGFWNKGDLETVQWVQNSMGFSGDLEFSDNNGLNWISIRSGDLIANQSETYTPTNPTLQALVRIRANDAPPPFGVIVDVSDRPFPVKGIRVVQPQFQSLFTIGATTQVSFVIASTDDQDGNAPIYYAEDGINFDRLNPLNTVGDIFRDGELHAFSWVVESFRRPSAAARLRVEAGTNPRTGQPYFGLSEEFTVRGIKIDDPAAGAIFAPGARTINWTVAGISADAQADILLSLTGGSPGSFTNVIATGVGATVATQPWLVPNGLGPSTNARIRIRVTSSSAPVDVGYFADSDPFFLQGLRVTEPLRTSVWNMGSTQTIRWDAAAGGALVDVAYSPNGGVTYDAQPVQNFVTSRDGTNALIWITDFGRSPSTNARIRVTSRQFPTISGESAPFTMRGIRVLRPTGADIYATTDATNLITWLAVTTSSSFSLSYIVDNGTPQLIQSGVTGSSYNWNIPLAAISTNIKIRVSDGFHANTSAVFRVVDVPTIAVNSPLAGEFWDVGSMREIQWSRGGQMPNDFSVFYSLSPYVVSNLISSNQNISFNAEDNIFSLPWQVPNQLTQAVISVRHNDPARTTVRDESPIFNIVGRYRLRNPPGPFDAYALKPNTPIVWETLGSVPFVDLYYSLSAAHESDSWVKINDDPIPMSQAKAYNPGDLDNSWNSQSYPWTVVNARTSVAKVRVQEANYGQKFDPAAIGPFADSGEFAIRYYTVFWDIYDSATLQKLDRLTIVDSSGWAVSDASTTNGISNDYPWGTFNTEVYREGFFDASILFWPSENTTISFPGPRVWTQRVAMVRSQVTEEYHVLANFSYNAEQREFTINSWMERGGTILDKPTSCTIRIYDASGQEVDSITSDAPLGNGVFWMTWNAGGQPAGAVFFAKVEILYSGSLYSSGLTFTLSIPLSEEIAIALTNVVGGVDNVLTNVADVIRQLEELSGLTSTGFTNLTDLARQTTNMLGEVREDVKLLTNQVISVLGPGLDQLTNAITTIGLPSLSRILSRPEAVALGSTNMLLYKTRAGYDPGGVAMQVFPADSGSPIFSAPLSEVVPGLWQFEYVATWGVGRYRITVADPNANDSIMMRVVSGDLYALPNEIGGVSNQLAAIESQLLGLDSLAGIITNDLLPIISNITINVGDITNTLGVNFAFIEQQVGYLTNGLATLTDLDKIAQDISRLTNSLGTVMTVTNLGDMIQGLTNALQGFNAGDIVNIRTNVQSLATAFSGGNWSQVQSIQRDVMSMTNALFAPEGMVFDLNLVTGKLVNVNFLQMQQDLKHATNALGALETLTPIVESLGALSNSIDRLAAITNLGANVAEITNALSGLEIDWNDVEYIRGQVDVITNRLTALDGIGEIDDSINTLTGAVDRLVVLTNLSGQLTRIETAVAGADFVALSNNLELIIGQVTAIDWTDVDTLRSDMQYTTNALAGLNAEALAALLEPLTNSVGSIVNLTNVIGDLNWDDIKALQADVGLITNQLSGLDGVLDAITGLSNAVGSVGNLTNLEFQLAALTNQLGGADWDDITAIQRDITTVTNQLGGADWAAITAMQRDIGSLTNQLGGADWDDITAMQRDIDVVTNSLAVVATLAGLSDQITLLIDSVTAVGELTNTLAGADWGDVTTIEENLTILSASLQGLNGVDLTTFDVEAATRLEASMQRVALASQVDEVMRMLGVAGAGAGTVFGQLDDLSDRMDRVGVDAKNAAQRAQSAKSRADEAAGSIQALQSDIEEGDLLKVMARVREIQASLQAAAAELQLVPKDVDPANLYASVRQMAATVNQLAESKGFGQLLEGIGGEGEGAGQALDADMAKELNLEIQKVRAGMEFMQELVDEMRFEPVVHQSLLGVE